MQIILRRCSLSALTCITLCVETRKHSKQFYTCCFERGEFYELDHEQIAQEEIEWEV